MHDTRLYIFNILLLTILWWIVILFIILNPSICQYPWLFIHIKFKCVMGKHQEVGLLNPIVVLFLTFWVTPKSFFTVAAQFWIPTNSVKQFPFLHIRIFVFLIIAMLTWMMWYLIAVLKFQPQRNISTPMLTVALLTYSVAQLWEESKRPLRDECINKMR